LGVGRNEDLQPATDSEGKDIEDTQIENYKISSLLLSTPNSPLPTDDKVYKGISNKVAKEFKVGENFSSW
jgi:hypothetical protein